MGWLRTSLLSLLSRDLAIDLGTANSLVYCRGLGIVIREPSIVAVNRSSGEIEAVGEPAKAMLGRNPDSILIVRPMQDGVIADFEHAERLLQSLIRRAHQRKFGVRPRIVIGVPSEITQVEKRAVRDSAMKAGAAEVHLVEQPLMAAIGAGLPITEPTGSMIVDIGGGTTDVAVISMAGIVYSRVIRVAGNKMDDAVRLYIKRNHDLLIGERTAEQVKIAVGSAFLSDDERRVEIRGRSLLEGVPKSIRVSAREMHEALAEPVAAILDAIHSTLEQTPPELAADIAGRGIVLTGGGALLHGLDRRVAAETGLPVAVAEDPLTSVVLGTGRVLDDFPLLRRLSL
jgi:rod shape-determining protein MreB